MGVNDFIFAVHIHGLRHPTDTTNPNPIVLSTGLLPSLGSVVSALSTAVVLPILRPQDVSGLNWTSDPRRVIGSGGQCVVKISDLKGEWGTQLIKTPKSTTWSIEETLFSDVETTVHVKGKSGAPPTDGDIYWVEGEAVLVEVASTSTSGATLTLTRAQCGSRAIRHRLDPLRYRTPAGIDDRLILDSRPDFAAHTFTAQLFLFRLDQYGAVSSSYVSRYCYVEGPPSPQKGRVFEVRLRDIGELLAKHKYGAKERTVNVSHRVRVRSLESNPLPADAGLGIPKQIELLLTRAEVEQLTREPVHRAGIGSINQTMLQDLNTAVFNDAADEVSWFLEIEASGKWLFEVNGVGYVELGQNGFRTFAFLYATLVENGREPGNGVFEPGNSQFAGSLVLKDGWGETRGEGLSAGETAPKATLRCVITANPIDAFLLLCCDDSQKLCGRLSPELPLSWFQVGSAAITVATIDPGTTDLAKREQLLPALYYYALQMGAERSLGDYLAGDLCLPHALLLGPVATTGKLTLRPWARPQEASPVTLPTQCDVEIEPGQRLPRVSALRLSSGFNALTLEPTDQRMVQTVDFRPGDEVQQARIWQPGNQLGAQSIASGSLSLLVAGFLDLYGGAPVVYEVPTSIHFIMDNSIEFLDYVTWSNNDVLSEDGAGISGVFLLLGFSIEWRTGKVTCRIVKDTYEESEVVRPPVTTAPSWKPPIISIDGKPTTTGTNTYRVPVTVVGHPAADIGDLANGAGGILTDEPFVRVVVMKQVPDASVTGEKEGLLEAYGVVTGISYDSGAKQNFITIEFDAAWHRGAADYINQEILVPRESYILFTDERPAESNIAATDIQPKTDQLYADGAGINFVKVADEKPFDRVATYIKQA